VVEQGYFDNMVFPVPNESKKKVFYKITFYMFKRDDELEQVGGQYFFSEDFDLIKEIAEPYFPLFNTNKLNVQIEGEVIQ